MYYRTLIMAATNCTADVAAELEDIMRHCIFHSTLDWQTKEQLEAAAREALLIHTQLSAPS